MKNAQCSLTTFLAVVALMLCYSAHGATLIYEGFEAGGATPGPGQYQSAPVSTNGSNNDSIRGQGPAGVGFDAGDNWSGSSVASFVYPRVLNAGLNYTDTLGNTLNTAAGAVDWHRDTSGTFTKGETRATNLSPSLPNTGYFSALFQFTDGAPAQVELTQEDGGGGNSRDFFFGFNDTGNVIAGTSTALVDAAASGASFAAGETYLLFGELVNDGVDDNLRLWINPSDLSNPTGDAPLIVDGDIGPGWVGGNPNFTIRELSFFTTVTQGSQSIFDEIRIGETPEDVLPFTAIPEPASIAIWSLLGLGLAGFGFYRARRKK